MKPVKRLIYHTALRQSTPRLRAYFRTQDVKSLEYLHDYQFTNIGARALMNLTNLEFHLKIKVSK